MASASRFSEEEFQEACAELQRPRVSGWEIPVVTSVIKVYQRPLKKLTGLHEYKVSGIVRSPPDLLADVYMDLDYRKQWDQYVQEVESKFYKCQECMRMGKRECVYVRQRRDLNFEGWKVHVILAQSISVPWFSEKSGMIRVKQYKQSLAIQSYDSWRSEVFMYYFNNPGGQIPFWILNNFTKPTGLYEYKLIGTLRAPPDLLADTFTNLGYIKRRIPQVTEAYETECNGETVIYMKMVFPFLLSNRDQRRELDFRGRKIQVVLAKGTSVPQFPERSGFIRVRQCQVKLAMESDGSNRSKVLIYCFINPGGRIPSWIINLVVKNGIPGFLADLEDACLRY
ncbi:hypothetical protein MJG53_014753 [Ovis ammon polii x Ovis aries]|uniref:Uncharacterized protein n=1 Tax=Ovis ammon polii x Ovis aries TaxID=2918886 RepID=A0ACB9UCW0_9CETA|nr:hypothetical protein MJG53_014753 [Ovis ammon polii x Ovis aries]